MRELKLERVYSPTETIGILQFGNDIQSTIERPWIPTAPGGAPRESCIPAGTYDLIPHQRPSGEGVYALINPGLGVYYLASDRLPQGASGVGRYLILIHVGNWVTDVVGCIAPGLERGTSDKGPMVKSSKKAMEKIIKYEPDVITITGNVGGAFK